MNNQYSAYNNGPPPYPGPVYGDQPQQYYNRPGPQFAPGPGYGPQYGQQQQYGPGPMQQPQVVYVEERGRRNRGGNDFWLWALLATLCCCCCTDCCD